MAQVNRTIVAGASALAMGAGLMYALDPTRGRARRARLRDRFVHTEHSLSNAGRTATHDLANRGRGFVHDLTSLGQRRTADDDVILARVQSRIGRAIAHPRGIEVSCRGGVVTLQGPALRGEVEALIHEVSHVRGVAGILNRLDVREEAGHVAWLQGERSHSARKLKPGLALLVAGGLGLLLLAGGGLIARRSSGRSWRRFFEDRSFAPRIFGRRTFAPGIFGRRTLEPQLFGRKTFEPQLFGRRTFEPALFGRRTFEPALFGRRLFAPRIFA
jgi:hypothetical protein